MSSDAKFRLAVSIAAIVLVLVAVRWVMTTGGGMCGNDLLSETPSTTGKWKVVVFERSCGATTGFVKQASVMKANEYLDDGDNGNITTSDGYWTFKWADGDRLIVEYTGVLPAEITHRIKDVTISYEPFR
jgi:hypothetical protein